MSALGQKLTFGVEWVIVPVLAKSGHHLHMHFFKQSFIILFLIVSSISQAPGKSLDFSGKYDDAKWHWEDAGEYHLAATHIGFMLTFLIESDLHSEWLKEDSSDLIQKTLRRETSPVDLILAWDGSLVDEMINEKGNEFLYAYYEKDQEYLTDFTTTFGEENVYKVEPTWQEYDRIQPVLLKQLARYTTDR